MTYNLAMLKIHMKAPMVEPFHSKFASFLAWNFTEKSHHLRFLWGSFSTQYQKTAASDILYIADM